MKKRASSVILIGLILAFSPIILAELPFSFNYPLIAQISMFIYGSLLIVGGFLVSKAERYGLLLDLFMFIGILLLPSGPITNYPLGQDFWAVMSLIVGVFVGLPTVLLLHLNRKNS
ncbi:MAG: hypothetical protein ABEJ36_00090 [Candidatus Nanosalina sp.]